LENSLQDHRMMRDALVGFLGLSRTPDDLLLVTAPTGKLEHLISEVKPILIIVDSLRSFRPDVTEKNAVAGEWLKKIRRLTRKYGCAFVFVHHLRKPGENWLPQDLTEESRVVNWLLEMEGPRALVNQTDVRMAVAPGDGKPVALKVKWSRRVYGDSPLVLLERVFDVDGDPAGYRHLTGADFLSTKKKDALAKLPNPPAEFSFQDAKQALGDGDNRTGEFLRESKQLGLVEKLARNRYKKLTTAATDVGQGDGVSGVSMQLLCTEADAAPVNQRSIGRVSVSRVE
jgi:hypothetical protein